MAPTLFLTEALAAQEEAVLTVYADAIDERLGKVKGA
jgi:hypothetical protein